MPKEKSISITNISIEEVPELTLEELCNAYHISPGWIDEMIAYGIIEPAGTIEDLHFNQDDLRRIRTIIRLQQDLELNLPGAALVVDLIEELESTRARLEAFERYFNK